MKWGYVVLVVFIFDYLLVKYRLHCVLSQSQLRDQTDPIHNYNMKTLSNRIINH